MVSPQSFSSSLCAFGARVGPREPAEILVVRRQQPLSFRDEIAMEGTDYGLILLLDMDLPYNVSSATTAA